MRSRNKQLDFGWHLCFLMIAITHAGRSKTWMPCLPPTDQRWCPRLINSPILPVGDITLGGHNRDVLYVIAGARRSGLLCATKGRELER